MDIALIVPAFIAGLITFLAPCTLPLVPGYLGFISGISIREVRDHAHIRARWKLFTNGLLYVAGFSVVFIVLGMLVGLGGAQLVQYRFLLGRIGGIIVMLFGAYMLGIFSLPHVSAFGLHNVTAVLKPGNPVSSFLFGATFAFGWTPCVGPVVGSILIVAASQAMIVEGAILLTAFSLGLGLPFLIVALGMEYIAPRLVSLGRVLQWISVVGGVFLIAIGFMLLTNTLSVWTSFFYDIFGFVHYDILLQWL